tara:strand:- start:142 stop:315 length:174 start_codon:yes stop_codon:yes gene_type:complete
MNEVFFILVGIVMCYIAYKAYKMMKKKPSDGETPRTGGNGGGGTDPRVDEGPDTKIK